MATTVWAAFVGASCSSSEDGDTRLAEAQNVDAMDPTEAGVLALALPQDQAIMGDDMRAAYEMLEPSCRATLEFERFASLVRGGNARAFEILEIVPSEASRLDVANTQVVEFRGHEAFVTSDLLLDGALVFSEMPEDADRYVYVDGQWWGVCDLLT